MRPYSLYAFVLGTKLSTYLIFEVVFICGFALAIIQLRTSTFSTHRTIHMFLVALVCTAVLCFNAIWFAMPHIIAHTALWFADLVFYFSIVLLGYIYAAICIARANDAFKSHAYAWLGLIPIGNFILMFWDPIVRPHYSGATAIRDIALIGTVLCLLWFAPELRYDVDKGLTDMLQVVADASDAR
ncbi:hypothetical protein [Pseudovibrio sp. POLY-S9]|uniref:hypothetical protein n=1 Tax=Pseudovibrio sp. POLY-S9 TaxID=1576596 RepID=UPI00070F0941|nr:hypothetical protein [Pseudovibrio sp. POLY-S9]